MMPWGVVASEGASGELRLGTPLATVVSGGPVPVHPWKASELWL